MKLKKLRPHDHPDLSDYVVHLVGRTGKRVDEVPEDIQGMAPEVRLAHILRGGEIRAFPAFGGNQPVVCFSECTRSGIAALVASGRYHPWGVAFQKDTLFRFGGGPVFYIRGDEWVHRLNMPDAIRFRASRFWPGAEPDAGEVLDSDIATESDWLHEREWRVLGRGDPPRLRFETNDIAFLIVATRAFRDQIGRWINEPRGPGEEMPFVRVPLMELDKSGGVVTDDRGIWVTTQD